MAGEYDEHLPYDAPNYYDGDIPVPPPAPHVVTGGGTGISSHTLLTPQVGTGWSKEEAERWIHRLGKRPRERQAAKNTSPTIVESETEDAGVAVLLTLLLLEA